MMRNTGRVSQLAASAILVLLILVPSTMLVTAHKASLAWLIWTFVSLWAALDAVQLTTLAFPEHHSPTRAVAITMLAVVNMALSLALALSPTAWMSSIR
jgi:hypothetical protein